MVVYVVARTIPQRTTGFKNMKRSLILGLTIGGCLTALLWLVAACSSSQSVRTLPITPPVAPVVILAAAERSMALPTMTATSSFALTVVTSAAPSIVPSATTGKRGSINLAWDPSPETVSGYRIHFGKATSAYDQAADAGLTTNATISGLDEGTRYYFAASSYLSGEGEGPVSNEASGVTDIYIGIRHGPPVVETWGMLGLTNVVQISTNLTTWQTLAQFVGDGTLRSFVYTNSQQAWFRVEVK